MRMMASQNRDVRVKTEKIWKSSAVKGEGMSKYLYSQVFWVVWLVLPDYFLRCPDF